MNEFDIADNNLDFDAQDNRPSKQVEKEEAKPTLKLGKKHISSETEEKPTIEAARPVENEETDTVAEAEPTELELLRAKCDELGIEYSGRHKETGLKKLIEEHNAEGSEPFKGGEDAEDEVEEMNNEDPYSGSGKAEEEEDVPNLDSYLDSVSDYDSADDLAGKAKAIVSDAMENGIKGDDIEALKEAINAKYRELKQG